MTWMLLALLFSPPILINSYITSFIIVSSVAFVCLAKSKILKPQFDSQLFLIWFPFLIVGAFVPFYYGDSTGIWDLRYFLLPITLIFFFLGFYSYYQQLSIVNLYTRVCQIFVFFLFINSLLSLWWIFDRSSIGFLDVYNKFHESGYGVSNYWRYIGLYGNPNFDAAMFGYGLLFLIALGLSKLSKWWMIPLAVLIVMGLFSTLSRSVIAALIMVPIINSLIQLPKILVGLSVRNILLGFLILIIASMIALITYSVLVEVKFTFFLDNISRLSRVFDYFSNERFKLVLFYIDYFSNNTLSFVLGNFAYKPEMSLYSSGFTDNDYLYLVLKYGLVGVSLIVWLQVYSYVIGARLDEQKTDSVSSSIGKYLKYSSIFSLVVAMASVPFSNPKIFFVQMVFYMVGIILYKKNIRMRNE